MKIDWQHSKSSVSNRNVWKYTDERDNYSITEVAGKYFWLHHNENYIGGFITFKRAEKVVELILKG